MGRFVVITILRGALNFVTLEQSTETGVRKENNANSGIQDCANTP